MDTENGKEREGVYVFRPDTVARELKLEGGILGVVRDNLVRLNLITRPLGVIPRIASDGIDDGEYWGVHDLTALGAGLINTCAVDPVNFNPDEATLPAAEAAPVK